MNAAALARLKSARGFIFDMDGTLVLGDKASDGQIALPGAVELLAELRRRGAPYQVFTNGTARTPASACRTRFCAFSVSTLRR